MAMIETISGVGAGPAWEPLDTMDYAIIGATTVVDVTAALFIMHVVWNAGWPPYTAADPQLLVYTSMAVRVVCNITRVQENIPLDHRDTCMYCNLQDSFFGHLLLPDVYDW